LRSGQKGPFAVIVVIEEETDEVMVTTCGGQVILEKLREAALKGLLPLQGTFHRPEGKKYFTLD